VIRSTQRRRWSERGTTLLEVVVTVTLLTGGIFATVSVMDGVANATTSVSRRETALGLARDAMEAMRSVPYDALGISESAEGFVPSFEERDTVRVTGSSVTPIDKVQAGDATYVITQHVT